MKLKNLEDVPEISCRWIHYMNHAVGRVGSTILPVHIRSHRMMGKHVVHLEYHTHLPLSWKKSDLYLQTIVCVAIV